MGLVDFKKAWQFQRIIFEEIRNNYFHSALVLCHHYPVITMGRQANKNSIRVSPLELKNRGIYLYEIERAGDVTYHGPGQLTAYPIMNLNYFKKDIHLFLRKLEGVVIDFLADFGISGSRRPGLTGVWIGKQKISSIGIAIKNWITFHGVSVNIKKEDLANFQLIKPCGMDIKMTSLESILNKPVEIDGIKSNFILKFKSRLQ